MNTAILNKLLCAFFLVSFVSHSALAQRPGGVQSGLYLWLSADSINQNDNSNVGTWQDLSGNNNNAAGVSNPRFRSPGINGKPAIEFNGINEYYNLGDLSSFPSGEVFTVIQVDNDPPASQGQAGLWNFGSNNGGSYFPDADGNIDDEFGSGNRATNIAAPSLAVPNIYNVYAAPGDWQNSLNGTVLRAQNRNLNFSNAAQLGRNDNNDYLQGRIAELILYNRKLNEAERRIINNYLSSKYGITIANDLFALDLVHKHDLAGIGRVDNTNIASSGISGSDLKIQNASGLDDNEFLLFGHDNGAASAWVSVEVPNADANLLRIAREWRLDETGDLGTVDVLIDSLSLPAKPAGFTNYAILIDADGDFSQGAQIYPLANASGSELIASNVNFTDQDYVTIALIRPEVNFTLSSSQDLESAGTVQIELSLNYSLQRDVAIDYTIDGSSTATAADHNLTAGTVSILANQTTANVSFTITNDALQESDETLVINLASTASATAGSLNQHTFTINDNDNPRLVKFSTLSTSVAESAGTLNLNVELNTANPTQVTTVDYQVVSGTATATLDLIASGTASFPANTTTTSIGIQIVEDALNELDETAVIQLSNPTNAALANDSTSFTLTITDNDAQPTVGFANQNVYASESAAQGSFELTLSAISGRDVSLRLSVQNNTATNGQDFILTNNQQITIPAGQQSVLVPVPVIDDQLEESSELFRIFLYALNGATLGQNGLFFNIADNDQSGFSGPAGVGDQNTNFLWYDATSINQADNTNVGTWLDLSGNENHAAGVSNPRLRTAALNGANAIEFNGVNEYYNLPNLSSFSAGEIFTVLEVDNDPPANAAQAGLWEMGTATGNSYYPATDGNIDDEFGSANGQLKQNITVAPNLTQASIYNVSSDPAQYLNNLNGTNLLTDNTHNVGFSNDPRLGRTDNNEYFQGRISEVVLYNTALNSAQRKIVTNYLASKYGISISNDLYTLDNVHKHELGGIGRDDASNQHRAAETGDWFRISAPSSLDDGDFLLFAHDNADFTTWNTSDIPATGDYIRLAREWRFAETNDIGTVTLTLDTTVLPAKSAAYSSLVVLVDQDGNFTSGATAYPLTNLTGSIFEAINVDIPNQAYLAIAARRETIAFSDSTVQLLEQQTPGSISVQIADPLAYNVSVDFTVTGGSASAGTDFILSSGTATITAGNTSALINITVINDTLVENDETIVLSLSNPSNGLSLGTISTATLTINDDDNARKLQFAAVSGTGLESVSTVPLTVNLSVVDATNPTTVDYFISGGTATPTLDATASGTLTIPAGQSSASFNLLIAEDGLAETNETVIISLTNPVNASLGSDSTSFTYTIQDNDAVPVVGFTNQTVAGSETTGQGFFELSLSALSGNDVTLNISVVNGTATNGSDFILQNNQQITIPAGQQAVQVPVTVINDNEEEGTEQFRVWLYNISGATLGTNGLFFNISDNDQAGFTGPGGVGDATTNFLWLDATTLNQGDNTNVGTWNDISGNGNNAAGVSNPRFRTTGLNGLKTIEFNGVNEYYNLADLSSFNSGEIFTVLEVDNDPPTGQNQSGIWDMGDATGESYYPATDGDIDDEFGCDGGQRKSGIAVAPNLTNASIYNVLSEPNNYQSRLNGNLLFTDNTHNVGFSTDPRLGRSDNNAYLQGRISEVVLYNQVLNTAQRKIVQNYLSSKYSISIADDLYGLDVVHKHNVSGIGRDDASNIHAAAQSTSAISVSSPSALGDGDFMLFGHDNASVATWTSTEVPNADTNYIRLAREWRFDITGTPGTVSISVDTTAFAAKPSAFSSFALLVDVDGNFSSGAVLYDLAYSSGSVFEATNVTIPDQGYVAIVALRQEIEFEFETVQLNEPSTPGSVKVVLSKAATTNTTVNYTISGGTATNGSDYILSNGTATITPGNTQAIISLTVINDTLLENDETVILTLSNPSAGTVLGQKSSVTFTINDDDNDRKIKFSSISGTGDEGVGLVPLTIETNLIDPLNDTEVEYYISGGTATAGVDATANGTAIITAGNATGTFPLAISEDALSEGNETVEITLINPTNASLANDSITFTYTIQDNETAPVVGFANQNASGSESTGSGTFELSLSSISGNDVTLNLSVQNGTAINGTDFNLQQNLAVTIPAGQQSVVIPVTILNDNQVEGLEQFRVWIYNINGATLGTNGLFFNISDNDQAGFTGPAGVGDQQSNFIWLDATSISQADNTNVGTWNDLSGNNNNAAGVSNPRFRTNGIGGKGSIEFNGVNEYYNLPNISSFNSGEVFAVIKVDNDPPANQNQAGIWDMGDANGDSYFPNTNGDIDDEFGCAGGQRKSGIAAPNLSNGAIYNVLSDANRWENYLNGNLLSSDNTHTAGFSADPKLGRSDNTRYLDGLVSEFILYNQVLNSAQRKIVQNYLAAKYDFSIADDLYLFQTNYGNEVAGIGRDSLAAQHTAARSGDILTINSPSNLGDGEFMLFGHNGGSIDTWSTTELDPSLGDIQRLNREWALNETGDIGDFSVIIDTASFGARPAGYNNYVLLIDNDGNFSSGATAFPLSLSNGIEYQLNNVSITNQAYLAIACSRTSIQFQDTFDLVSEITSPGVATVELSAAQTQDVTVDYTVSGTATSGQDFILNSGTLTFTAGNTSRLLNITIVNDTVQESNETVVITLSNPSSGISLGSKTTYTLNINDDDNLRRVRFSQPTAAGLESVNTVNVNVESTLLDPTNATTVDYVVTGGTATGGGPDFTLAAGTVTIPANSTSGSFAISINEDAVDETDETIEVSLFNPTNASLADDSVVFTYTIQDNDNQPTIQFAQAAYSTVEGSGSAQATVELSAVAGQTVTVNYSVTAQTATAGVDYFLANGMVTINAGDQFGFINPLIYEDAIIEPGETFRVQLWGAAGATLQGNTFTIFTIGDNDNVGIEGPGGVGDAQTMQFWVDATTISQADNTNVGTWLDLSGNNRNLAGVSNPRFRTAGINNKGAIEFNGTNEYYTLGNLSALSAGEIFMVSRIDNDPPGNQNQAGLWDMGSNNGDAFYPHTDGNIDDEFGRTTRITNIAAPSLSTASIYNVVSRPNLWQNRLNGTVLATDAGATVGFSNDPKIGRSDGARYFDGVISEVILYTQELNTAQRKIVENYLAAKYDLTIADDRYQMQATHGFGVAGIGQDDATNFHSGAWSQNFLKVESPTDLEDGEYMIFGHNNGSINTWTATEAPDNGSNSRRIEREYVFDISGGDNSLGGITVSLDLQGLPVPPAGFDNYALLVDADGDFSSGATSYTLTNSGGTIYQASNVPIGDLNFATVAVERLAVQFTDTVSGVFEPDGPALIAVELSAALPTNITVDYALTGGSVNTNDYVAASGTITIPSGSTSGLISFSLINDTISETDETVELTLSNPSGGVQLGDKTVHTFTIQDDDNLRKIQFTNVSASGDESVATVNVQVEINTVDNTNATTVEYFLNGGTATAVADATALNGTVSIPAGSTTASFSINIVDDTSFEPDETLILSLRKPTNANLAATNTSFTYTIQDNDNLPTVAFTSTTTNISEAVVTGPVEVSLSAISGNNVTVNYTVNPGTATAGVDYSMSNGTVTIPAGQLTANINAVVIDDFVLEGDENFSLTLSAPVNATLGANTTNTITILDNEINPAQSPGGVSANLAAWLRAGRGVEEATANPAEVGDNVRNWNDQSGSNVNAVSIVGAEPTFVSNGNFNGNPALQFNGTSDWLKINGLSGALNGNHTVYIVQRPNTAAAQAYSLSSNQGGTDRVLYGVNTAGNLTFGATALSGTSYNQTPVLSTHRVVTNNSSTNFINGTAATGTTGFTSNGADRASIGQAFNGTGADGDAANFYSGEIAEIIVYNTNMNSEDQNLVESYLALKYGLTKSSVNVGGGIDEADYRSSNGTVIWDNSVNASYSNDIAGIGFDNATALNLSKSRSANGDDPVMMFKNGGIPTDGSFVLWGNNNQVVDTVLTGGTPAYPTRSQRTWKVASTGTPGQVEVWFVLTAPLFNTGNPADYALLIDNVDADFTAGATAHTTGATIVGDTLKFTNVSFTNGAFFTLGTVSLNVQTIADGQWNQTTTWSCGCVPDSSLTATVLHNVSVTTDAHIGALTIAPAGSLSFTGSQQFIVKGDLSINGSYTPTNSSLILRGNQAQTITAAADVDVFNVQMANAAGVDASTSAGNFRIYGTLSIPQGILNAGGRIVIASNATRTGRLDEIGPTAIAGNITAERYFVADQDYRLLGSPIQGQTFNELNDDIYTTGFTGSNWPTSSFNSISWYDETQTGDLNTGYVNPANINEAIVVGRGYYVYTVGDRTLDFTGTVNQGTVSLPVTYTTGAGHDPTAVGWNVVSNPYPSAIDWDDPTWTKTNIANQFAIYDAQNNVFASYAGGVGTNMLGRTDQSVIPAFQAFWVLATGASPVLEANEGVKINNNEGFYGRPGDPADLMRIYVSDGASTDEAIVRTGATYVDVYNGSEDAVKFFSFSPTAPTVYSLTSDNVNASINAFSPFSGGEIIPLRIRGNTIRFESTFSSVNFALGSDAEGYLFDIVVDSTYTINTSGLENYYLIVNTGASPLPVDLVSFSAEPQASHVALAWETASEYNSSHFVVQKSTNGSVFNDLATVKAAGFSSSANTYEAQDFEPTNGLNYYRLKQFDFDGSSETFNTLVVSWNAQTQESKQIQVLTEALGYTLIVPEQAIVGYRVFDTKGALLQIEEAHNGNSVFVPRAEGLSIIQLELEDGETIELKLP